MDGEGKKYKSDFIRKNMKSRYEKMTHTNTQHNNLKSIVITQILIAVKWRGKKAVKLSSIGTTIKQNH